MKVNEINLVFLMNSELEVAQLGWHFPPVHEASGHSSCHTQTCTLFC